MNTIFTKLKTSATLWSVIGGFAMATVIQVWGNDSTACYIATALTAICPSVAYIVGKFALRIKAADANNDNKLDSVELVNALKLAVGDTKGEAKFIVDTVVEVIKALKEQEDPTE